MYGVFLHVLADTLGSVAVIISSLWIKVFGTTIADPICCFVISALILAAAIPFTK
jgi:zinc transporter 5/7